MFGKKSSMSAWIPDSDAAKLRQPGHDSPADSPRAAFLLTVVDWSLLATLFISPLFFGGRHDLGRFVFVLFATSGAVAWFTRQAIIGHARWTRTAAHLVVIFATALLVLQLIPMPANLLARLSPTTAELLPLWSASDSLVDLPGWRTFSLVPVETRISLAVLIAYGFLFVTAVQRLEQFADIERLLKWIAMASIGMACFGVVQYFLSNGHFFWFYEYPHRDTYGAVCGSFINRNHFAHFVVLGFAPLVAWILKLNGEPRDKRGDTTNKGRFRGVELFALVTGLVVVVLAVCLSCSRGGILTLLVSMTALLAICWVHQLIRSSHAWAALAIGVVLVGLLSIYGYERVTRRLDQLTAGSMEVVDRQGARRQIWEANLNAIGNNWLAGTGAGSHRYINPVYLERSNPKSYSHAENGYLQVLTENGLFGGVLMVMALGLCTAWSIRALRATTGDRAVLCTAASVAGIAASAAHSLVDFVWYIPACMSIAILLAASVLRLSQLARSDGTARKAQGTGGTDAPRKPHRHLSRPRWIELAIASTGIGAWAIWTLAGPATAALDWDGYRQASIAHKELALAQLQGKTKAGGVSVKESNRFLTTVMIDHLQRVVRRNPNHARAQLRLASRYLERFELNQLDSANQMSTTSIRDAAIASEFDSPAALRKWLEKAFSPNYENLYLAHQHARRAAQLSPLQGEAYLLLADLCFLEGGKKPQIEAYIQQGLRVRPADGDVLFEVGKQRWQEGRVDEAFAHWQTCFPDPGTHQLQILDLLVGRLPSAQFVQVFEPDWESLRTLWRRYHDQGQPGDIEPLVMHAQQLVDQGRSDASHAPQFKDWMLLKDMYREIGRPDLTLQALGEAYALRPNSYWVHHALGFELLEGERYREAEPHLRWCLTRRPKDARLRQALLKAAKGSGQQADRTATLPAGPVR